MQNIRFTYILFFVYCIAIIIIFNLSFIYFIKYAIFYYLGLTPTHNSTIIIVKRVINKIIFLIDCFLL